mmetsp:Transcript_7155/g.13175  ORF Transcript_7155/g.13175 Transcript_7155/m.13175 type:complete len:100 (-) Transcript_7155:32-331(-)
MIRTLAWADSREKISQMIILLLSFFAKAALLANSQPALHFTSQDKTYFHLFPSNSGSIQLESLLCIIFVLEVNKGEFLAFGNKDFTNLCVFTEESNQHE